jgi:hypothetical protein
VVQRREEASWCQRLEVLTTGRFVVVPSEKLSDAINLHLRTDSLFGRTCVDELAAFAAGGAAGDGGRPAPPGIQTLLGVVVYCSRYLSTIAAVACCRLI